jgi:hypothetical protein
MWKEGLDSPVAQGMIEIACEGARSVLPSKT